MRVETNTLRSFRNPGAFQAMFIDYLEAAGLKIDNSKTIAGICFYDSLNVQTGANFTFFAGLPVLANSNLQQFIRAQTEHSFIVHIRVLETATFNVNPTPWTYGVGDPAMQNSVITINSNGQLKLKDYPLTNFLDGLTTIDNGLYTLENPILWAGQTDFLVNLVEKDGQGAINFGLRIELLGLGLV